MKVIALNSTIAHNSRFWPLWRKLHDITSDASAGNCIAVRSAISGGSCCYHIDRAPVRGRLQWCLPNRHLRLWPRAYGRCSFAIVQGWSPWAKSGHFPCDLVLALKTIENEAIRNVPGVLGLKFSLTCNWVRSAYYLPVIFTVGLGSVLLWNGVSFGIGMVAITPALLPTQSTSAHATSDVMRRHAILWVWMISSTSKSKYIFRNCIRKWPQRK